MCGYSCVRIYGGVPMSWCFGISVKIKQAGESQWEGEERGGGAGNFDKKKEKGYLETRSNLTNNLPDFTIN